ncbi:MAG: signal peptidase [Aeromicrobium sp.]|nr:signal peptidase [Aeromicrobium sp.]
MFRQAVVLGAFVLLVSGCAGSQPGNEAKADSKCGSSSPHSYTIPTVSMEPLVPAGSHITACGVSGYKAHRGDVVVFKAPVSWTGKAGVTAIKRVIAIGGDRISCCTAAGALVLNGKPLDETAYLASGAPASGTPFDMQRVPAGFMWVMGDNRQQSADSTARIVDGDQFVPVGDVVALYKP